MEVYLGPFTLSCSLMNRQEASFTHYWNRIGKGAAGDIYECIFHNEEYFQVVKCLGCADYTGNKSPLLAAIQ